MRYLLLIFCFSTSFFLTGNALGQMNRDSVMANSAKVMKKRLNLSDSATKVFLAVGIRQVRQTDSLGLDKSVTSTDRQKALVVIQQQNNAALQQLFTDGQWQSYKNIRDSAGQVFIQRMNALKIPIKKLPAGD